MVSCGSHGVQHMTLVETSKQVFAGKDTDSEIFFLLRNYLEQ